MSVAPAALFCLRAQVHFLCTQGARVQPAPGIPCALWIRGAELIFKTRANSCRENADSHLKNWTPSLRAKRSNPWTNENCRVGKANGSARTRGPMTGSACPPQTMRPLKDGGHGACAPLPTLQLVRDDGDQLAASSRSSVKSRIAASASIGSPKAKPCAYSHPNW